MSTLRLLHCKDGRQCRQHTKHHAQNLCWWVYQKALLLHRVACHQECHRHNFRLYKLHHCWLHRWLWRLNFRCMMSQVCHQRIRQCLWLLRCWCNSLCLPCCWLCQRFRQRHPLRTLLHDWCNFPRCHGVAYQQCHRRNWRCQKQLHCWLSRLECLNMCLFHQKYHRRNLHQKRYLLFLHWSSHLQWSLPS